MSELALCYTGDIYYEPPSGNYGDATYRWSDPSVPADYYQSFNTTGKGTIDQTIFSFVRNSDKYTAGNYISFFTNGTNAQQHPGSYTSIKNNFVKNNDNLCVNFRTSGLQYDPCTILGLPMCKYSPGVTPYSVMLTQRFLRTFQYNNYCLLPKFTGYAWDIANNVQYNFTEVDGATVKQYESQYDLVTIHGVYIKDIYYGSSPGVRDNTQGGNIIPYIQFAGTIPTLSRETGYGGISFVHSTSQDSGVYLFGLVGLNGTLFRTPWHYKTSVADYGYGAWTNESGATTQFCLYDVNEIADEYEIPDNGDQAIWCLTPETAFTMIDRLGYNWSLTASSAATAELGSHCTDSNIRCAVIDPNGNKITTQTLQGSDIMNYAIDNPDSNYNWDVGAADYNGSTIIEIRVNTNSEQTTVDPVDEIDLNLPVVATTGGTTLWMMTPQKLDEFFTFLWNPDGTRVDDILKGAFLFGETPMDSVISLRFYPLNLQQLVTYSQHKIMFGRYNTGLSNYYVSSSNVIVLDLGGFTFNDAVTYNDFRDYEPYTRYSIYVPFCGIIPLNAFECINTVLSLKMIVDLNTGACTTVVYTNDVPYKYVDGMIGIEVPVTGRDMAGYAQTVLGAALGGGIGGGHLSHKGVSKAGQMSSDMMARSRGAESAAERMASIGEFGMAADNMAFAGQAFNAGALTGAAGVGLGVGAIVGGAAISGTVAALSNAPAVESAGSNAPAVGLAKPLYPYFIVQRSDCWIPDNYEKLYGRPCNVGGVVGDFAGFSTFGNLKLENISEATSEEKILINDLLQSGVYI